MWFKVVVNKDGSVASCEEVGSSLDGGRRVFYVEAKSRAEAVTLANKRYREMAKKGLTSLEKRAENFKRQGLCVKCGAKPEPGRQKCSSCMAKARASSLRSYYKDKSDGIKSTAREWKRPLIDGAGEVRSKYLRALREALTVFDETTPKQFREWLVGTIRDLEGANRVKAAE